MRRFALVFVCQHGRLEAQSVLLAASLRRFCRLDAELITAVPEPASQWGQPAEQTLAFLKKLSVRIVPVRNQIDPTYPIGNKIGCLSLKVNADKLILLDSDMILMRPWEDEPRWSIGFHARPAAAPSFSADDRDWDSVYAACGCSPLPGKIRTIFTDELIAPYFNSAVVAVPADSGFGDVWLDCCRRIDAISNIPNKRPHLDQIALSPAVSRLGLKYDCLEDRYNYPINFKTIDERNPPLFCHYHDNATLAREPAAMALVRSLIEEHPELSAFSPSPGTPGEVQRGGHSTPELILTGIPRSGTSYLCNLLHRHDNCVILNEPDEIGPALERPTLPWPVATFYRDQRREILAGRPIRNKLTAGQVTEDTAANNEQATYTPHVRTPDFVLGVKTTIPFLSRLPHLRRVMPNARIVAVVRNPFDTIASWKTSFPHLRDADVNAPRIGNPRDPWLSGRQRAELERIATLSDPPTRRAAWWCYLAESLLDAADDVILVRYDDLVTDPQPLLDRILQDYTPGRPSESVLPSDPRRKSAALDAADIQAIRSLCSDSAGRLGVYRPDP